MIAGEIKRYLRDDGILKVSRSLKENCVKIYSAREKLEKELGREPVMEEICILRQSVATGAFVSGHLALRVAGS